MTIHFAPHPQAGQTVKVDLGNGPVPYRIEDWWDRVSGGSWMFAKGNPACMAYVIRTAGATPIDDEVVYGKAGLGHLVHISEIKEEAQMNTPFAGDDDVMNSRVSGPVQIKEEA